jgi:hypothetical protein
VDLLTVALACSLYPDPVLVETLIRDASGGQHLYFVGDAVKLDTYDQASSTAEAQKIIAHVRSTGGRPVVGLMGIPLEWADRFGKVPDDLFDGCTNVAVGTAMLSRFASQCRPSLQRRGRAARRRRPAARDVLRSCVLAHFGRELGIQNFVEGTMREVPQPPSSTGRGSLVGASAHDARAAGGVVLFDESARTGTLFFRDTTSPAPTRSSSEPAAGSTPGAIDDRSPVIR